MTGFAELLDAGRGHDDYGAALGAARASVHDPDRTPSARALADMRAHGEGYFHFARRMSEQHRDYFLGLECGTQSRQRLEASVAESLREQQRLETRDARSFDEFLEDYFSQRI
jgi:glutamate--cysteine ligase